MKMAGVARRSLGLLLALGFLCGAGVATAATRRQLYRTDRQAELFLDHRLGSWAHVDLRKAKSKAAFCVSAVAQRSDRSPGNGRSRSFSCVLDARLRKEFVFGIHLVSTPRGWRATPLARVSGPHSRHLRY
jgi:hypothetical protein